MRYWPLAFLLACAGSQPNAGPVVVAETPSVREEAPSRGEEILETGGELVGCHGVRIAGEVITACGMTEVPDGSRMQAAQAMVDAIARAELFKALEVSIASFEIDVSHSQQEGGPQITQIHAESIRGVLPALAPPTRGWQRVRRDGEVILRLFAQVSAERAALYEAVGAALARHGRDAAQAVRVVDGLASP